MFAGHPSFTILLITSDLRPTPRFHVTVEPTPDTGLQGMSQAIADKAQPVPREKISVAFGRLKTPARSRWRRRWR